MLCNGVDPVPEVSGMKSQFYISWGNTYKWLKSWQSVNPSKHYYKHLARALQAVCKFMGT